MIQLNQITAPVTTKLIDTPRRYGDNDEDDGDNDDDLIMVWLHTKLTILLECIAMPRDEQLSAVWKVQLGTERMLGSIYTKIHFLADICVTAQLRIVKYKNSSYLEY